MDIDDLIGLRRSAGRRFPATDRSNPAFSCVNDAQLAVASS
jgi:hypothetical protein